MTLYHFLVFCKRTAKYDLEIYLTVGVLRLSCFYLLLDSIILTFFVSPTNDRLVYMLPTQDLNILEIVRLRSPRSLKSELPMTEECNRTVVEGRAAIQRILLRQDS